MFYKNIVVKKPVECIFYPSTKYVYYTSEKIYIKDKKYNQNKRVMIGKMIDEDNMIPNDNAKKYYPQWFINETRPDLSDTLMIGNTVIVNKIMGDTGLSSLLDSVFGDKSALIKDLIFYFAIGETTTLQHFRTVMRRFPIFSDRLYSDSTLSRLLKENIKYKDIDVFLKAWNNMYTSDKIYMSYDGTNINTYGEGIEIADYGHAKDDSEAPIVNIGYAVDQSSGRPLFYDIYPGDNPDTTQLTYMVDQANGYGYKNIGIILDRGYFSADNIKYIIGKKYDLIMMVKTNQKKINDIIVRYRIGIANRMETYIEKHEVYGKTFKEKIISKCEKEFYVHIYYDGETANDQRKAIMRTYNKMEESLVKKIEKTKLNRREDMTKYDKYFHLTYDDNGYLLKYTKKEDEIQKAMDKAGYFALVTSEEMSASDALDKYRDRDVVEKLFRSLKSEMDFDRFRVHDDASMQSKIFITFLANIVRNEIYMKTKGLKVSKKDRKSYTMPSIIEIMNTIEVTRDSRNEYIKRYAVTKKQSNILECFGLEEKDIIKYVEELNKRISDNSKED